MLRPSLLSSLVLLTVMSVAATMPALAYDASLRAGSDIARRSATAYRFRSVVDSAAAAAPKAMTAKVVFTALDGGPAVPSVTLTSATHGRAVFSGKVDLTTLAKASFEFQIPEKVVMEKDKEFYSLVPGGGWVDAVDPSGLKVRIRVSKDGVMDVVVFNEDRDWDPSSLTGVNVIVGTTSTSVPYVETRQTWKADMAWGDDGPALGSRYTASVTLLDSKGTTLDTLSDSFVVGDDTTDPGVSSLRVASTAKGAVKVVSWTYSDGPDSTALEMAVTDSGTGKTLIDTTDDAPVLTELQGTARAFFKTSPVGHTYKVTATPVNAEGKAVAPAEMVSVTVSDYDKDSTEVVFAENTDGSFGLVLVPGNDTARLTWTAHGRWDGSYKDGAEPATWSMTFVPTGEAPATTASTLVLGLDGVWSKWVQKGVGALSEGSEAEVVATLTTAEGDPIDALEASGTERVYGSGDSVDDVEVFIQMLTSGGSTTTVPRTISRTRR